MIAGPIRNFVCDAQRRISESVIDSVSRPYRDRRNRTKSRGGTRPPRLATVIAMYMRLRFRFIFKNEKMFRSPHTAEGSVAALILQRALNCNEIIYVNRAIPDLANELKAVGQTQTTIVECWICHTERLDHFACASRLL